MRLEALLLALAACGSSTPAAPPPPTTGTLVVHVTSGGKPIPARIAIADASGAPVHRGTLDLYNQRQGAGACVILPGVLLTWSGLVLAFGDGTIPVNATPCALAPGRYTLTAWHGIEYETATATVDLPRAAPVTFELARAITPTGTLAADLHVHGLPSNDSTMPDAQRVSAQLASGLQVIGFSNHNFDADLNGAIAALHLQAQIVSIPSSELTSDWLHAGTYPVPVVPGAPNGGGPDPATLVGAEAPAMFAIAHAMSTHPIVQVNHPRFRYGALFDISGWDGVAWPPPFPLEFDAVETIGGFTAANTPEDRRIDDSVRDLYTMTDHGKLVAAMGNSDAHDFTWIFDGTARTYVYVPAPRTQPFDQIAFVAAIRAHHTEATTCPFLDVTPRPGDHVAARAGKVDLHVALAQAGFCHATRIKITVGNKLVLAISVTGKTADYRATIDVGTADTWIGVTADGDDALPLTQTGTYQRDEWKKPGVTPYAVISPILVDADGDGRWKRGDADLVLK